MSYRVLVDGVTAAQNGAPPPPDVVAAIRAGGSTLRLEDLNFDSLGWMEFCISVELQTGAELTSDVLASCETMADVAGWLARQRTR